jgi:hypothetical protein
MVTRNTPWPLPSWPEQPAPLQPNIDHAMLARRAALLPVVRLAGYLASTSPNVAVDLSLEITLLAHRATT